MILSETGVILFQVKGNGLKIQKIIETAHNHFRKKESLLFFVEDEKALHFLDELLWKIPETSFLPHSISDTPKTDKITITKTKNNRLGSLFAFNLCPTPLLIPGFKNIYDFEDLSNPFKKNLSEMRFKAYKDSKMSIRLIS